MDIEKKTTVIFDEKIAKSKEMVQEIEDIGFEVMI